MFSRLKVITRHSDFKESHKRTQTATTNGNFLFANREHTQCLTEIDKHIRHYSAEIFNLCEFHICSSALNRFCFSFLILLHCCLRTDSSIATESSHLLHNNHLNFNFERFAELFNHLMLLNENTIL